MQSVRPCSFPFPGGYRLPLAPAEQPLSWAPQSWVCSALLIPSSPPSSKDAMELPQPDLYRSWILGKPRAEAGRRLQSPAAPIDISSFTVPAQTHESPKSYAKSWREIRGFTVSGGSGRKKVREVRIEPICCSIWSETLNRVIFQVRISAAGRDAFLLIPAPYFTREGDGRWHRVRKAFC